MVDDLKANGIILHNHICGNTIPIINEFIATGAQVLEIDHKTDMRKAKDAGRGKTCFLGHDRHRGACVGHAGRGRGCVPRGDRDHGAGGRVHPGTRLRTGHGDAGRRTSTRWWKRRRSTGATSKSLECSCAMSQAGMPAEQVRNDPADKR